LLIAPTIARIAVRPPAEPKTKQPCHLHALSIRIERSPLASVAEFVPLTATTRSVERVAVHGE